MIKKATGLLGVGLLSLTLSMGVSAAQTGDGQLTTLDISQGSITIGAGSVSSKGSTGQDVTTPDPDGYTITGTTTSNTVQPAAVLSPSAAERL